MDLKRDYNKLYQQWSKEVQDLELTTLTQENFKEYKKSVDFIESFKLKKEDYVQFEILKSYKENFRFLYSDFLKLREIKIINAAFALQEIDFKRVIEAEKLFFQNLVSSIKGFKKLRELSVHEELASIKFDEIIGTPNMEQNIKTNDIIEINGINNEPEIQEYTTVKKNDDDAKDKVNYNYTLIRFLKKTPPLVGIDLKNYGPFEKEDIALIPYKNAIILLSEKFAEKMDIPK